MNPQCGYYQPTSRTYGSAGGRPGSNSSRQFQAPGSTYGGCSTRPRAPATFPSSTGSMYAAAPAGYQQYQQQSSRGCRTSRPVQNIGRSTQYNRAPANNCQAPYKPVKLPSVAPPRPTQQKMDGPQYCTPQAIKVNVTADQLLNAKNKPIFQDRSEACQEDNGNMKYIQLNWQDLLGGMENLRVTMGAPNCDDANNPNRQLKVSFGGQRTDPPQAGETPLKVVSIQPAQTTERMDLPQANAYAGHMKVCNPQSMRMAPAPPVHNQYCGGGYAQPVNRPFCRR